MKPQRLYEVREPRCWKKKYIYIQELLRIRRRESGRTDAGMRVRVYSLCIGDPTAGVAAGLPGAGSPRGAVGDEHPKEGGSEGGLSSSHPSLFSIFTLDSWTG